MCEQAYAEHLRNKSDIRHRDSLIIMSTKVKWKRLISHTLQRKLNQQSRKIHQQESPTNETTARMIILRPIIAKTQKKVRLSN